MGERSSIHLVRDMVLGYEENVTTAFKNVSACPRLLHCQVMARDCSVQPSDVGWGTHLHFGLQDQKDTTCVMQPLNPPRVRSLILHTSSASGC